MEEDLRSKAGLKGKTGWAGPSAGEAKRKEKGRGPGQSQVKPNLIFFVFVSFFLTSNTIFN